MAQAKLTRKKVFFVKVQSGNAAETPTDANAVPIYQDAAVSFGEIGMNSRAELAGSTLSNVADVVGLLAASVTARVELKGSGDVDIAPEVEPVLLASSMARYSVKKVEVAPLATALPRGITLLGGTSTAEARLAVPAIVGDDFIYLEMADGSPAFQDAETISEAVASVEASGSDVSVSWAPIGPVIGGCLQVGDTLTGATSGAKLRVERKAKNGDAYLVYSVISGTPTPGGESYSVRAKSVATTGAATVGKRVLVDASTLLNDYPMRAGLAISGTPGTGVVAFTFDGTEDYLYFTGAGGFTASSVIVTTPPTATSQSASVQAGFGYRPTSSNQQRATIAVWEDGYRKAIYNAQMSWSLASNANELPILSLSGMGPIAQELTGDVAAVPAPDFQGTAPAPFRCAALTLVDDFTTFSPVVSAVGLDIGNNVAIRPNANACTGSEGSIVTSRNPTGSIEVEQVPAADYPLYSKLFSGSLSRLGFKFGCAEGNVVWAFADAVQYAGADEGDNGGLLTNTITFGAKKVASGDDELELVFI